MSQKINTADWRLAVEWPARQSGYVVCAFFNAPPPDQQRMTCIDEAAAYIVTQMDFPDEQNRDLAEHLLRAGQNHDEALDLLSAVTQSDGKVSDLLFNQILAFLRKVGAE
ncbi:hypothetical protein LJR231_003501 [Phyllobacterium sp. LjRoot231]|uniref:hypothetical protein n=1 Tax=Phyllobacterium sp. LjRoot231 TaxID=3342289 RepID=UPI003ECECE8F